MAEVSVSVRTFLQNMRVATDQFCEGIDRDIRPVLPDDAVAAYVKGYRDATRAVAAVLCVDRTGMAMADAVDAVNEAFCHASYVRHGA